MKDFIKYILLLVALVYGISYSFGPLYEKWQKSVFQKGVDRYVEKFDRHPQSLAEVYKEKLVKEDPKIYLPKQGGRWALDSFYAKVYIERPVKDEQGKIKTDRYGKEIYERVD